MIFDSSNILNALKDKLNVLNEFKHEPIEGTCRALADELAEGKLGKVMMPLRSALAGTDKSPALFDAIEILGKEKTFKRIQNAIDYIEK